MVKRRNPLRRVNPNKPRTISQKGGHGMPSTAKKIVKRKKLTPAQASYAPRGR